MKTYRFTFKVTDFTDKASASALADRTKCGYKMQGYITSKLWSQHYQEFIVLVRKPESPYKPVYNGDCNA